ncbi:MAG: hypothetical protein LBD97_00565 [Bifidobacteriaceae bacterium]|jgi:uncharacterized membrane protein YdjX (TVP38/TMEM64 family)|nr:hypothetical protein [Bifidobacteriaceae bacterium]
MIATLTIVATSLVTGFVSALFPLVNAELATGVAALSFEGWAVWAAVVSLALGLTAGKVVVYEASRAGRTLSRRWRLSRRRVPVGAAAPEAQTGGDHRAVAAGPPGGACAAARRWLKAFGHRLIAAMDRRWRMDGVILLSAVVGLPPLLATSVAAGLLRMRRLDFVLCVAFGRIVRLVLIAWPIVAAT